MRILFLHEVNYLEKPIFEMHEFPEHLAALGHEIAFVQFPEGLSKEEVKTLGWKARIPGRVLQEKNLTLYTPQNAAGTLIGRLKTAFTFRKSFAEVVVDFRPDVVVSFSVPTSGWQALAVSKKLGIPFVFRALDVSHLIRKSVFSPLILSAEKFVYRNASAVSANNSAMADYCRSMGAEATRTFVDLPPIDLSHFANGVDKRGHIRSKLGISPDSKAILYMGSFFYFSGLPQLVDEFAKSAQDNSVLVLVGGGEQDQELRHQVAKLGLTEKVLFTGFVNFAELPGYLAAADVAVNPMQSSLVSNAAFPNKVIQYLATGLAVATTRLKGLWLTFGDVPGIRYSETPEQVMRDALELAKSPNLAELGAANQTLVAGKFSQVEAVKAFENRLQEVVQQKMTKVLVLGATGMLGSAVVDVLQNSKFELVTASRTAGIRFDAESLDVVSLFTSAGLESGDYVINCVGLTKSRIDESSPASRAKAVRLNVDFPAELARVAGVKSIKVIQVATDCVYSGAAGGYNESAPHDPVDLYGETKNLGEIPSDSVMHLRCSLIGPELGRNSLFFEWVRQQPNGAAISGYTDHLWNGLSSKAFGRVILGILTKNLFKPGVQHLVPADQVTKDELVRLELRALGRHDVSVTSITSPKSVDRTLSTENTEFNKELFAAAGYSTLPTISQMVDEICADLPN